jgi:hypothetical protein
MDKRGTLLLVSAGWSARRLRRSLAVLEGQGAVEVVAFTPEARRLLQRCGVAFRQVVDFAERPDEFDLTRIAIRELNEYSARLVGGKPLAAWLEYRGTPLWNFVSPNLFADVNALLKSHAALDKILSRCQPLAVAGLATHKLHPWLNYLRGVAKEQILVDRLAQMLAQQRGIPWQAVDPGWGLRLRHVLGFLLAKAATRMRGGVWLMVLAALLRRGLARAASARQPRGGGQGRPLVLFFSHLKYWRRDYNPMRNDTAFTDTAIYPVVHSFLAGGRFRVEAVDGNYGFWGAPWRLAGKLFAERQLPWQVFDTWYPLGKLWACKRGLRQGEQVLARRDELERVFSWQGLEMGRFFLPRLEFVIRDYLWKSALWLEAGRRMVQAQRPAAVVLTYETGTLSRAIIHACHEQGVPALGLQHGAFSAATDDYVKLPHNHLPCFTPNKTAVWGERFRRVMLENSAYREEEVVVTGNPRLDFLFRARSLLNTESLYRKYGLEKGKKLVLVAPTETIGRTRHLAKERFFAAVVAAQEELDHCQWVAKLKPGADSRAYYQALLRERGGRDMVLTEEDLYPLLVAADAVVTPPSSIAIEALIVGKPVVYVVFADAEDYFPHLRQLQAVLPVSDSSQLSGAISRALAMEGASFLPPERMQALLEEENHQPDGRAAQRVVEVVEGLIDQAGAAPVRAGAARANT